MDLIRIAGMLESALRYCLAGIFGVWAAVLFFVFVLSWEAWFFGIKLDGLPAGLFLFARAAAAALLAYAAVRYPGKIFPVALMAVLYGGFLFLDSAWTIQKNTHGQQWFSGLMTVFLIIPLALLVVHRIAASGEKS